MRQQIASLDAHPDKDALREYTGEAPDGLWTGRLDYLAWGRASNLLCYFTDEATGLKHRLSVFSGQSYKPYQGEVAFDEEAPGGRFELATGNSQSSGLPKFLDARKL
jgi:hypothetical protein